MTGAKRFFIFAGLVLLGFCPLAQRTDSLPRSRDSAVSLAHPLDTFHLSKAAPSKHNPHTATVLSAVLPGAGQVYNHRIWKVPIVYVAIGIPAYAFFYNKAWYNKCQYALVVQSNGSTGDSLAAVDPKLQYLASQYGDPNATNSLINYRNEFRKNQDYATLFFLIFWALNIVDATVDAHLKDFNVNDDLSLRIRPTMLLGNRVPGLSFVFDLHSPKPKPLLALR